MGQDEHHKAQVGSSWPTNGATWAPGRARRAQERPKLVPRWSKLVQDGAGRRQDGHPDGPGRRKRGPSWPQERPENQGTQKITIFGPLLGPVLDAFSCPRRSSEAFGWASFFGCVFGTCLGAAGKVKVAILYGTSAKNTASDLKDKRQKTVPKSTPKIVKKRLGKGLLGCRNQDLKKVRKNTQKVGRS